MFCDSKIMAGEDPDAAAVPVQPAQQASAEDESLRGMVQEMVEKRLHSLAMAQEASGGIRGDPGPELGAGQGAALRGHRGHQPYVPHPYSGGMPPPHMHQRPLHYAPADHPPFDPYAMPILEGLDWQQHVSPEPYTAAGRAPYPHLPYMDHSVLEDYRNKRDMLHSHFNSQLRPKLDALRRQIVGVEQALADVAATRDFLLAEATADHQVHVDQIHLCAERKFGLLRTDLDDLMRDVQRIHAFTTCLSQPHPQSSAEVVTFLSRHMELQAQCSQLASKGFKTQIEASADDLRSDVASMLTAVNPKLHKSTNATEPKRGEKDVAVGEEDMSAEVQAVHLTNLLKVKSQMVDEMLVEKKQLVESVGNLKQKLKDSEDGSNQLKKQLKEAQQSAVLEQDGWNGVCEKQQDRIKALEEENARLKSLLGDGVAATI